jgi:hypothetical protein
MITSASPERRDAARGASWNNLAPDGVALAEHHAQYLEERGVTLEASKAAGYWTARRPSEMPPAFSAAQRRRHPTLIASHYSPDGETVSWQKHDDRPGKDYRGKPVKWASPPAERARTVLSVHPWMLEEVRTGAEPLWVCEGLTRGHALAPLGMPSVTYAGCYSWQKDGEPLPCWEHVNLAGRLVYDVPDADARTNSQVQEMQAARVQYLESRGARVLVVSVPEVNGDEHAGLDDYLAAGGDPEALVQDARPFVPVDVGRERLKRDDDLRIFTNKKRRQVEELPARKVGECGAVKVARYIVEVSIPAHGKLRDGAVVVHPSVRQIASGVRIGVRAVLNALQLLEDIGFLKTLDKPRARHEAASYLLLDPCWGGGGALGKHIETKGAGREGQECKGERETSLYKRESSPRVYSTYPNAKSEKVAEKLPALRNSKLVHTWGRRNGRRVVVHSDYFKRYGAKGEEIIRYVLEGGPVGVAELWEKFGSKTSKLGRFFNTWVKPIVDDGVFAGGIEGVEMAPDWSEALDRVRKETDEELDNRLQDEEYAKQRTAYRRAKDLPVDPAPELAGPEKVREIVEVAEKRDQAARIEEQRRKVGTTAETFLTDQLAGVSGFAWGEVLKAWKGRGGRTEDLQRAAHSEPFVLQREGKELCVYWRHAAPVPEREPAPVAVLREPSVVEPDNPATVAEREQKVMPEKVDGIYVHDAVCDCYLCNIRPKYARPRGAS